MDTAFSDDIAHIVYASDQKFAEILGVSLTSLFENNKDMDRIFVYILDQSIASGDKEKIEDVCARYGRDRPAWIPARDISRELQMQIDTDRGSISQYARLFLSSALPDDLDRVLYLDCDILIDRSIKDLWGLDLQGKVIAALMDAFSRAYRVNIDLEPEDIMFNSGVMLVDLKAWKDKDVETRLLDFIAKHGGRIQQGDQGALNAVLSHDTYCFEPRFNSITIFYDFTYGEMLSYRKPPSFYPEEQVKRAIEEPVLIHFTTSFLSKRPWIEGCQHRYVHKWLHYKELSPWKDQKLWKDDRTEWKRMMLMIYQRLPDKVALWIAGMMQAYGRPWGRRIQRG